MPIDDATWANVRSAYVDTTEPVTKICARVGIDTWTLYLRCREEHWPKRSIKLAAAQAAAKKSATANPPADANPPDDPLPSNQRARLALIRRLYKAIDTKLKQMEKLMASATETSAADHERETRTLTSLIRNFERVSEFDPDLTRSPALDRATPANSHATSERADPAAAPGRADADRLRRDITERLVRIREQRVSPRDAG
jgi:hypothetical protein